VSAALQGMRTSGSPFASLSTQVSVDRLDPAGMKFSTRRLWDAKHAPPGKEDACIPAARWIHWSAKPVAT